MLLKSTIQVTFFSFLGIIAGFLTQLVVAFYFGTTPQRDAYFAAIVIPTYLIALFANSLGVIFMSSYIGHQIQKTPDEIAFFVSRVLNIYGLFICILVIFGIVFSEQLVTLLTPGFKGDQLHLTSKLLRILLPTILFSVLSNLLTMIYYAHKRFLLPSVAPILGTVISPLFVILWNSEIGIESLAYGSLAASIFSFIILIPIVFQGKFYRLSFLFDKEQLKLFKTAAPLIIAGLLYRSTSVLERLIASTLEPGSISYLGYANQIMNYLANITSSGIATTIFPLMSEAWERNDLEAVRRYFSKGIRIVLLIALPIAFLFLFLGDSIVRLLFERGAFDDAATSAVSNILSTLMIAFICLSCGNIAAKGFYLSNNTKIFSVVAVSEIAIYLLLGYYLSSKVSYLGLSLASSLSTFYTIVIALILLDKIFKGLDGRKLIVDVLKVIAAAAFSGIIMFSLQNYILMDIVEFFRTSISISCGLLLYILIMVYWLPVEEIVNAKVSGIMYIQDKLKGAFGENK
ncbi:oligosaccharide flippase family protein [bacterium]|nr:oligosaccharide flippase family protein [bacterium]NUN46092.1 oligosaccharide flippase family protein [bacterium]